MLCSRRRSARTILGVAMLPAFASLLAGCLATGHPVLRSSLGVARSTAALLAVIDVPGPIALETVASADWAVPRGGLINLDHPRARAAGLRESDEPIQIYFHALRHPLRGLYLVDTGVENALKNDRDNAAVRGIVASKMGFEKLKVLQSLGDWLARQADRPKGVLLTHLHVDHITGLRDVAKGTPVYVGPGEARARAFVNMFIAPNLNRAFEGKGPIEEWDFLGDAAGRFEGIVDVFGDGSLWALHVPGHTSGSTAYLVRTTQGPVLLLGDACHTRWGWENDVEPGTYSSDQKRSAESLARLRKLAAEHPRIDVRFGHQR